MEAGIGDDDGVGHLAEHAGDQVAEAGRRVGARTDGDPAGRLARSSPSGVDETSTNSSVPSARRTAMTCDRDGRPAVAASCRALTAISDCGAMNSSMSRPTSSASLVTPAISMLVSSAATIRPSTRTTVPTRTGFGPPGPRRSRRRTGWARRSQRCRRDRPSVGAGAVDAVGVVGLVRLLGVVGRRRVEPVAEAPHGLQQARMERVDLDLRPQTADVLGHRGFPLPVGGRLPDRAEELVAAEGVPGPGGQERQQVELLGGEGQRLVVDGHLPRDQVDRDGSVLQPAVAGRCRSARRTARMRAVSSRAEKGLTT